MMTIRVEVGGMVRMDGYVWKTHALGFFIELSYISHYMDYRGVVVLQCWSNIRS